MRCARVDLTPALCCVSAAGGAGRAATPSPQRQECRARRAQGQTHPGIHGNGWRLPVRVPLCVRAYVCVYVCVLYISVPVCACVNEGKGTEKGLCSKSRKD